MALLYDEVMTRTPYRSMTVFPALPGLGGAVAINLYSGNQPTNAS